MKTVTFAVLCLGFLLQATAADKYTGNCNIVFEGDSTLHAFTGYISNIAVIVLCDTNTSGTAILNTRLEIAPKQLTTHHEKRDKNMYTMFQPDKFPKLLAVVTNAPLAAAQLMPSDATSTNGVLPIQLTFCGITKEASAKTMNQKPHTDGWEFDLQTTVSLKAFKLEPPSVLFGAISVADKVVIKAHVIVKKDAAK
ncbi:MAG: YceI family protein [Verrucomicrobiota bacterium]